MGEWEKVSIPSFEEYAEKRAGEASRDAVLKILSQRLPNVPVVSAYRFDGAFPQNIKGLASLALGKMGVPDEYRTDLFGYEPNPETCIFTSTSKYGDKNAAVSGNETFRDNPGKYGFVSIPVGEAEAGDMFQFSNSEGIPKHAAIYTGEDEESAPLVSYSRGGTGPTTITPRGEEPTMAHDVNIGVVTSDIGKPSAYRYVGTKQKRKEWAGDYYNRYNPKTLNPNLPLYNFKDLEFKPFFKFHEGGFLEPKSAWDKLSMREKAEMMKVAVRNGIYNLNDIREKYNEFAGGGALPDIEELGFTNDASINPIPEDMVEDFAALASPTQQPKLENLKKKGYGFNVEDYAYRVKKFHPNVTEEQVKNAYINTPVIASDRNRGRVQGAYNYGDENGYGRRIMMYPSTVKDFQGVDKSGRYSKDAQLGHIYTHENSHNLHDQVKKELTPEEAAILKAAYGDIFNTNGLSEQDALLEMEAENTKNREILSKAYNNATKDKLTNVINKDASDKEIINNWLNSCGYTQDDNQGTFKKILFGPDGKPNTEKVKLMRDAMNFVAFNPYEDEINSNYAALGGPLVQAANEYKHGGSIHIAPSKRGTFTAAAKKHGKSVQAFASQVLAHPENYSPAMRKKANFARNASHWKHGLGGNLFASGGDITYGHPFYSYDENGKKIDDTLNYNATIPEVVIIPDNKKTPAQRNEDGRFRQRSLRDYDESKSKELTAKQVLQSQKDWENSFEKQALNYAQTAATGIGIGADIVSGLPIYSSLKGASVLNRAETPMNYVEGGLWLAPVLGGAYQTAKPAVRQALNLFRTDSPFSDWVGITQHNILDTTKPSGLQETQQAAERGRNKLLDWVNSSFYKQRIEEEPFYRFSNDIVDEASSLVENASLGFDKTVREIHPSGQITGETVTRPALKIKDDGYRVFDLNTGLDVNIGSDLGNEAEDVTLHELLHYLTVNSKGIPESTSTMQIVDKGWMQPLEALFNPVGKNILRGKKWQSYILDQNDALLPKYDAVVDMVMHRPEETKAALLKAGRTEAEADVAIKSLKDRYEYWSDIQEQRAHLQELFISKIKPHLKNPNDAAEIEAFLTQHPDILESSSPYNFIQEVRPGSLKQYSKYFASALGTLPFIMTNNNE